MKLRILHTNMHRGGWGGQPNRILLLSKGLKERGHFVIIAAPKGATLIKRAQEEGIPTYDDLEFPKKFKPHVVVKEILKLKKLIEKEDIQIVHTHGSQDTWAATLAAKLCNPPRIVVRTRHNTFPVANHPGNRMLHRVFIDHIIVVSQGIIETYKKTGVLGHKIDKVSTIYSVVNPERFKDAQKEKEIVSKRWNIEPQDLTYVKTARLAKEKGHIYFLKAAKEISSKIRCRFFALGEGPLKKELEETAQRLNLSNVTFTGTVKEVPGFLAHCDAFLFTPISGESLGTAMLEALYMKVPSVTFWVQGVDASVEDGKTGFLIKIMDYKGLACKALSITLNRKLRRHLGTNGRKKVESQFILQKLIEYTEKVYLELAKCTPLTNTTT